MAALSQQLVEVDGATLEVFRGGAGRPIVCCSHPHAPDPASRRWYADHAELVYVMPRGFGRSSPPRGPGDLPYRRAAQDLEAVRRALGLERWVLEGFSGGSQVALLYALAYPDALAGLIVGYSVACGPRALPDPRSVLSPHHPAYRADLTAARLRAAPREPTVVSPPGHAWAQPRPGLWVLVREETPLIVMPLDRPTPQKKAAWEEVVHFDVVDRLGAIRVPTLVVCGRRDGVVPLEHCTAIHAGIPAAELLVLEHSGHGFSDIAEADLDLYRGAIRHFLAGLADRPAAGVGS